MRQDQRTLENKIDDPATGYIIIYPDPGIDIAALTHDLRALLTSYHPRGFGWTIGSNIEIDGQSIIGEWTEDHHYHPGPHPGI